MIPITLSPAEEITAARVGLARAETYKTGDVTQEFSANLVRDNYLLGENTDIIYLPVQYYFNQLISPNSISTKTVRDNFLMEILPDSTFSLLPR
jgi:hypothetical protein